MTEPTEPRQGPRSLADAVEEVVDTFWEIGSALVAASRGAFALAERALRLIAGGSGHPAGGSPAAAPPAPPTPAPPSTAAPAAQAPLPRIHLEAHERLSGAIALEEDATPRAPALPQAPAPTPAPPSPPPAPRAEEHPPLPASYGADRLTVLPRDPGTMFAFWEVRPETLARVRARLGQMLGGGDDLRLALRLRPLEPPTPGSEAAPRTVLLPPQAVSWYIEVEGDVRRIEVALGLTARAIFLELAPPVEVALPPRAASPDESITWTTFSGEPPPPDQIPEQPPREVSAGLLRGDTRRAGSSAALAAGPHLLELDLAGSHSAPRR